MAHYEHLPVYKQTMQLIVAIENAVREFPRYHKYAIGADLRSLARLLATLIIRANSKCERFAELTTLRDKCEELKMTIMVAKEIKAFKNFSQFQQISELAVAISRQSQGWLTSQSSKRPESSLRKTRR